MAGDIEKCQELSVGSTPVTLTISLKTERDRLQEKLDNLNEAIVLIESQPEIQKTLDALSKLGRLSRY